MILPAVPVPIAIGVIVGLVALALRWLALRRAAADRRAFVDPELLARIAPPMGPCRRALGAVFVATAAGLLTAALVAGHTGDDEGVRDDDARFETVIVLDASNSMLAEDVRPSRLDRQHRLARRMVGQLSGRIGVVYFAGAGYVLSPLTGDRAAILMFTEAVHPTHVGRGGTSLVDGLGQALIVLAGGRRDAVQSIVLLTDGESTVEETELEVMLERARRADVTIHTIGIGTAEGGRIPMQPTVGAEPGQPDERIPGPGRRWLRDNSGRIVVTRLDEASLRHIAGSTGGLFVTWPTAADALVARMPAGGGFAPVSAAAVNGLLLAAFLLLLLEAYAMRRA